MNTAISVLPRSAKRMISPPIPSLPEVISTRAEENIPLPVGIRLLPLLPNLPPIQQSVRISANGSRIFLGDVNADRKVDMQDVTTLINYLKDAATEVSKYTVDTNGDNKISVKDGFKTAPAS